MIISLHGSYFGNNYGDILLMKLYSQWIRDYDPSIKINYPLLKEKNILDPIDNVSYGLLNLLRSDALVYFGGGYFGEQPVRKVRWSIRNFHRHVVIGLFAILFRIPIAIIGVEIGPLSVSWFRKFVLYIAKRANCLIVRNKESLEYLVEHGLFNAKLSYDSVLSLSDYVAPNYNCSHTILLHISMVNESVITLLKSIFIVLKEQNINNVVFVEDGIGQLSKLKEHGIFDLCDEADIDYKKLEYIGTNRVVDAINESEMIITTKMHVGVTGIALNKKVFSVYTHPKIFRLHKQVGNEEFCMALNDVDNTIITRLRGFFNAENYPMSNDIIENARLNRKALLDFICNLKS